MEDQIKKTIEKLHQTGSNLRDTDLLQKPEYGRLISVLDLEKRDLENKRQRLAARRREAIKKLQERGFPTYRPTIDEEDHPAVCTGQPPSIPPPKTMLMKPDPDKPQNRPPVDLRGSGGDSYIQGEEIIPTFEPFVSDRVLRSQYRARLIGPTSTKYQRQKISDIFPQRLVQEQGSVTSDDELARKRLNTTVYEAVYGEPPIRHPDLCRRIFPLQTLQALPDPLRSVAGWSPYHPATSTWQPKTFNSTYFDRRLPRYDFINEERPYEVCSYAPRIDQVPTYSGCHGTDDFRVDDDNPYKTYIPLNKVRREVPAKASLNLQQNPAGYTGCIVDRVKRVNPTTG